MQNKTVSIVSTAIMTIFLVIGIVLIWKNIAAAPNSDEDLALTDQEFFSYSYEVPSKKGGKPTKVTPIDYTLVIDNKEKKAYDLTEGKAVDYQKLMASDPINPEKVYGETIKEGDVHYLAEEEYDFQVATLSSITYTQWLMYIALFAIAIFTVVNIIKNPKRFLRSAIGIVALAVIAFICYKMAAPVGEGKMLETSNYSDTSFKYTGAGIAITMTLGAIAIALILWQSVVSLLRFFTK